MPCHPLQFIFSGNRLHILDASSKKKNNKMPKTTKYTLGPVQFFFWYVLLKNLKFPHNWLTPAWLYFFHAVFFFTISVDFFLCFSLGRLVACIHCSSLALFLNFEFQNWYWCSFFIISHRQYCTLTYGFMCSYFFLFLLPLPPLPSPHIHLVFML